MMTLCPSRLRRLFSSISYTNSIIAKCLCYASQVNVLGIETSYDETGCAIVNDSGCILGEALFSQSVFHLRSGGVNPIHARELHRDKIESVVSEAIKRSSLCFSDINAIAVTVKPGLLASLTVGVQFANHLAKLHNKPLIPIHHMEAHALVTRMLYKVDFPYLILLISGGHCQLVVVQDVEKYILLGETLDVAPGETFDKIARRIKLRNIFEYSHMCGGQAIEVAASKATGLPLFNFPLSLLRNRDCNFSFSGLKDATIRAIEQKEREHNILGVGIIPEVNELCLAFQEAVTAHLLHRTMRGIKFCEDIGLISKDKRNIVISGGVACNNFIFESLKSLGRLIGYKVLRPPPKLCLDNGAMIA